MTVIAEPCVSVAERQPLVSAVIPTRNRPELVCRAVRSVLAQTYPKVEAVVVVDGADEVTLAALKDLNDQRVRIVALLSNVGGSEARNIGIRESRGEFVGLLDDDDEWLLEKLEKQVQVIKNLPSGHAVVTCKHIQRTPGKQDIVLPRRAPMAGEDISEYLFSSKGIDLPLYGPQTSTYIASRDLFLRIHFKKGQPCHQDWDWFLRTMNTPDVAYEMVDEPLCVFHVAPSMSGITKGTNWKASLQWIDSVEHLVSRDAFASFVVHQVMYRCDDYTKRARTFRMLAARAGARLSIAKRLCALKWFIISPQRRTQVKGLLSAFVAHSYASTLEQGDSAP
ncbi:MAG TPA: glycosyltransferase family A protein [Terriglobales bacterium]|jgi:glycosyltransferase involved in cell wall biosynthesis|nr:glycosyltransferase family A protein [Terriglobales bacterium]